MPLRYNLGRLTNFRTEDYALKLTRYTICRLIQCFSAIEVDDDSRDESDWQKRIKYQIGLTMAPDDGLHLKFTSR
jgi:hypothetical protein